MAPVPLCEMLAPGSVLLFERNEGERLGQLEPPASIVIGPEGGFSAGRGPGRRRRRRQGGRAGPADPALGDGRRGGRGA